MDSSGEDGPEAVDRKEWHLWHFGGLFYARRLKTSPPVVISGATEDEREAKIAAYLKHGREALEES